MKIYEFYENDVNFFYMVLELVDGGELFDRIAEMVGPVKRDPSLLFNG